jgi:hypothetical protein
VFKVTQAGGFATGLKKYEPGELVVWEVPPGWNDKKYGKHFAHYGPSVTFEPMNPPAVDVMAKHKKLLEEKNRPKPSEESRPRGEDGGAAHQAAGDPGEVGGSTAGAERAPRRAAGAKLARSRRKRRRAMAARTDVDICNMALLYAGVNKKINNLTAEEQRRGAGLQHHLQRAPAQHDERLALAVCDQAGHPVPVQRQRLGYDVTHTYAKDDRSVRAERVSVSSGGQPAHVPSDDASAAWWAQVTRDGYAYCCPFPDDCLDPIEAWPKLDVTPNSLPAVVAVRGRHRLQPAQPAVQRALTVHRWRTRRRHRP